MADLSWLGAVTPLGALVVVLLYLIRSVREGTWVSAREVERLERIHAERLKDKTEEAAAHINGAQVVGTRKTGWSNPTGTTSRAAFDTGSATRQDLAQRLAALINDLTLHGLIGA